MRWLGALILAASTQAHADIWLEFTPCGYRLDEETLRMDMEPAPNIQSVYVSRRAIMAVYMQKPQRDPVCSVLLLWGGRLQPVLGSYTETVNRIRGKANVRGR